MALPTESKEERMERVTSLVTLIDEADTAVCVEPKESEGVIMCTFKKNDEAILTLGMGTSGSYNKFFHYEGNNADLAERWREDELISRVELTNESGFATGGSCFAKQPYSGPIPAEACVVRTSGTFMAVSEDGEMIQFQNELLEE